jgi:type IV pilus assembly protein PilE
MTCSLIGAVAPCSRKSKGFTLIELMITVAIVAVLAAVAYPSYIDSVLKGRRAEARTALMGLMQQQERFATQTGSYAAFSAGATGQPFKTHSGDSPAASAYDLGARACDSSTSLKDCVVVFAVPRKSDPAIGSELTLSSTGEKDCAATDKQRCWRG